MVKLECELPLVLARCLYFRRAVLHRAKYMPNRVKSVRGARNALQIIQLAG